MTQYWKSLTRAGLTRQVLIWFLLISLVPLGVVSWFGYREADKQLYLNAEASLHNSTAIQLHTLNNAVEKMKIDIIQESDRLTNSRFLSALTAAFHNSSKAITTFIESYQWEVLHGKWASDLTTFWKEHHYVDILLIDGTGNVLFTVAGKTHLGNNIFKGPMAQTRFSKAAARSLASGRVYFSDLEYDQQKNNLLSGFIISPIIDERGEKIGLLAFQVSAAFFTNQLLQEAGPHARGVHYLIGEDLCLRTPGILGKAYPVLERPIRTALTRKWLNEHIKASRHVDIEEEHVIQYEGPNGRKVIGLHVDVELPGLHWAYISEMDTDDALAASRNLRRLTFGMAGVMILFIVLVTLSKTRQIVRPVTEISRALTKVGEGDFGQHIRIKADYELKNLVNGFNSMIENLKSANENRLEQSFLQDGVNQLNEETQGDLEIEELARKTIGFLCRYLDALTGAYYILQEKQIQLTGSFAFSSRKGFKSQFSFGEGLVGQAALERQVIEISQVPEDYFTIASGLGEKVPTYICVFPLIWNDNITVLLEFGTFKRFTRVQKQFVELVSPAVSVAAQTALSRNQTRTLLEKTQVQAEELQAREEELRDSNRLLEQQADDLRKSKKVLEESQCELETKNEQLNTQQEELRVANEELEEQARDIKKSRYQVETKNRELEETQVQLEQRAEQLSTSSKYKSEFLANMSHELRTPLNSLLILARLLAENKEGNLDEKQIEFSHTIYDSGRELLNLINEILDLSKIEAGRMETLIETVHLDEFVSELKRNFSPVATQKELIFDIETDTAPARWSSDRQKLGQIVKNMLSNAFKFTSNGHVRVRIGIPAQETMLDSVGGTGEKYLFISVADSGIGIPEDRLESIFEAFQQVDGSTSRNYGGTGLGLTISRELAILLGGELHAESREGEGSTFTLYLPLDGTAGRPVEQKNEQAHARPRREMDSPPVQSEKKRCEKKPRQQVEKTLSFAGDAHCKDTDPLPAFADDRADLKPKERSILIIEDDMRFVAIMADLARTRGFKVIVAEDGETGLYLADYYQPSGIVLDIGLPGMNGWEVMDRLKDNTLTRHIPVHFMTAGDFSHKAFNKGAVGFLTKPVAMEEMQDALTRIEHVIDHSIKRLLIVEDSQHHQVALSELLGGEDIEIQKTFTGAEAKKCIKEKKYDCIVLDYGLPDMNGLQLIEELYEENEALSKIPVIIYTGREMEPWERSRLDKYAQRVIIKSVRSEERLLDDTTLFLHRVETGLPENQQQILRMMHDRETVFQGRKVLLADDDMRNVFALSAILQEKHMQVTVARNGKEALEKIEADPDIDIVLMDIMMPVMDGYEATEKLRQQKKFKDIPIIALTAKALKGDRLKCIQAGASDYLSKPVDTDKLLSMMRVWLYQK